MVEWIVGGGGLIANEADVEEEDDDLVDEQGYAEVIEALDGLVTVFYTAHINIYNILYITSIQF